MALRVPTRLRFAVLSLTLLTLIQLLTEVNAFVVTPRQVTTKQQPRATCNSRQINPFLSVGRRQGQVVAPNKQHGRWSFAIYTTSTSVGQETAIDVALTMNRLCILMILVSYLPWPRADPSQLPTYYQSGEGAQTYEELKAYVQPLQDKIDNFTDGVTLQDINDLLFSKSPNSTALLEFMRQNARKRETKWSGELSNHQMVLRNLRPRKDDGNLVYIRTEDNDPDKVFAVVANHKLKRITLVFRGSQNVGDWITNIQIAMKYEQMGDLTVGIHDGFYGRLQDPDEALGIVTLYKLVSERVRAAVPSSAKEGSYSLFVTGHSLGGAMATVCGLFLVRDKDIAEKFGGPVTVVSLASPRVGDHNFRRVHQHLEKNGRLRHLRCMNDDDIVPTIPYKNLFGKRAYTHVGLRWVLNEKRDKSVTITMAYPDVEELNWPSSLVGKVSTHFTWIYRDRLLFLKKQAKQPDLQLTMKTLFDEYLDSVADPTNRESPDG